MFLFPSSANASPEFEGRGGEELAAEFSRALERSYNHQSAVDLHSLIIIPGQQCWVLYIDALVSLAIVIVIVTVVVVVVVVAAAAAAVVVVAAAAGSR